jgi:antitoxin HicB
MLRKLPLVFSPQPEGGFTVTSPVLPELLTEGDTLDEAYANVSDALAAVLELYAAQGRPLPESTKVGAAGEVIWSESLVEVGGGRGDILRRDEISGATSRRSWRRWAVAKSREPVRRTDETCYLSDVICHLLLDTYGSWPDAAGFQGAVQEP